MAFMPMERRFYQFCSEAKIKNFAVNSKTIGIKKRIHIVAETESYTKSSISDELVNCNAVRMLMSRLLLVRFNYLL